MLIDIVHKSLWISFLFASIVRVVVPWASAVLFAGKKRKEVIKLLNWGEFIKEIIFYWVALFIVFFCIFMFSENSNDIPTFFSHFAMVFILSLFPSIDFILKPIFYRYINDKYQIDKNLTSWLRSIAQMNNIEAGVLHKEVKNAYSAGIKPFKQVIEIGKPLKDNMSGEEQKAIILHELGHIKNNHLMQAYLCNLLGAFIYWVCFQYTTTLSFYKDYEFLLTMANAPVLLIFSIFLPLLLQRRLELEADAFSASIVGVAQYEQALRKLDEITNGEVTKGGINYPTLQQRIDHIKKVVKNDTMQKMVI